MDNSLGITLRRDFAEKLEKLLKTHFSNLNQAQNELTGSDAGSQPPRLSFPNLSRPPYTLKPFYEPSSDDDKPVAKATDRDTPNSKPISLLRAIFSNSTGKKARGLRKIEILPPKCRAKNSYNGYKIQSLKHLLCLI
ncbi:MAG: hypothetical protein ACKO3R_08405 [bacterium]